MKGSTLITVALLWLNAPSFSQKIGVDYYLDQALVNSPLLRDYEYQAQATVLDSQRIRAGYQPQVTGSSINLYAPIVNGFGYDVAISNGGNFTSVVAVDKTLVGKKNLSSQFGAVDLQGRSIRNASKISEQDLKRTVTAQYITAYGDLLQLDFYREIGDLFAKEEKILRGLTEKNVYRQTDYLTFLVTLQQQSLLLRQWEIQYKNDLATLNYLSGILDTSARELEEPLIELDRLPDFSASVFLQRFTIDSLKLSNSRSLVDFSYKPKAHLFADAGYSSSLAFEPYKNFGTSFGFSVTVPIYDGHQKKIQYQRLEIAERTRAGYEHFFSSQYHQQIAQLMQQIHATDDLIEQINDQIRYSERLIQVQDKLLETGDVRISDLILALSNYLTAKNLLTQNHISRLQIINQFNYWNR